MCVVRWERTEMQADSVIKMKSFMIFMIGQVD